MTRLCEPLAAVIELLGHVRCRGPICCWGRYGENLAAARVAGHELNGLRAVASCGVPYLHFPLACVIR